jgi:hypothetical protein
MYQRLFFLLVAEVLAHVLNAQSPFVVHEIYDDPGYYSNHIYTWVNNATLRKEANRNAMAMGTLPIGSVCELIKSGADTVEIAGIGSPWYYVRCDEKEGWIWGGLLTKMCVGSNVQSDVKFLMGYQLYDDIAEAGFKQTYVQIRAIKNNTELSSVSFPLLEPTWGLQNLGSKGLKGVHDIIAVAQSGESCGHFYGNAYVLWDGVKLMDPLVIGGVPDGDFGVWDSPIFPADIEGKADLLILDSEDYTSLESTESESYAYVSERLAKRSFTKWENGAWIPQPELSESKTLYYLVSGTFGDIYFPEEMKILPSKLPEEIKDWINSHKQNLR